jgi:hypothetical protein
VRISSLIEPPRPRSKKAGFFDKKYQFFVDDLNRFSYNIYNKTNEPRTSRNCAREKKVKKLEKNLIDLSGRPLSECKKLIKSIKLNIAIYARVEDAVWIAICDCAWM